MPSGVIDANAVTRCVAHKKDGQRCKKAAIRGGKVCRSHGGAAKQVQRAARERFNDSIDPMLNAMAQMAKEIEDGTISPEDRRFFMKFVADRTGFVPGKAVNVEGPARWEGIITHVIKELPEDQVLEAEVVDEEAESEREKRRQREREEQAARERARDLARDALPQIVPPSRSDERASVRIGSADPPQRPDYL